MGIQARSDQSVTSGASLPAVHVSPKNWKVVRPRGSQRGSRWLIVWNAADTFTAPEAVKTADVT